MMLQPASVLNAARRQGARLMRGALALTLAASLAIVPGALMPDEAHGAEAAKNVEPLAITDITKINRIALYDKPTLAYEDISIKATPRQSEEEDTSGITRVEPEVLRDKSLALRNGTDSIDEYILTAPNYDASKIEATARYRHAGYDRTTGRDVDIVLTLFDWYCVPESERAAIPINLDTMWPHTVNSEAKNKLTSIPNIRLSSIFSEGYWQVYIERVLAIIEVEYSDEPGETLDTTDLFVTVDNLGMNYSVYNKISESSLTRSAARPWYNPEHVYVSNVQRVRRPGMWIGYTHYYPSEETEMFSYFTATQQNNANAERDFCLMVVNPTANDKLAISTYHDIGLRQTHLMFKSLGTSSCADPVITGTPVDETKTGGAVEGDRMKIRFATEVPATSESYGTLRTMKMSCAVPKECTVVSSRIVDENGYAVGATSETRNGNTLVYDFSTLPASLFGKKLIVEATVTLDEYPADRNTIEGACTLTYGSSPFTQSVTADIPLASPEVEVEKAVVDKKAEYLTAPRHAGEASEITFSTTLRNTVEGTFAHNVVATENLPEGLTYVEDSLRFTGEQNGSVEVIDGKPVVTVKSLGADDACTYTYTCTIGEAANGDTRTCPTTVTYKDPLHEGATAEPITVESDAFVVNDPDIGMTKRLYRLPDDVLVYTKGANLALQYVITGNPAGVVARDIAVGDEPLPLSCLPLGTMVAQKNAHGSNAFENFPGAVIDLTKDDAAGTWGWNATFDELDSESDVVLTVLLKAEDVDDLDDMLAAYGMTISNYDDPITSEAGELIDGRPSLETLIAAAATIGGTGDGDDKGDGGNNGDDGNGDNGDKKDDNTDTGNDGKGDNSGDEGTKGDGTGDGSGDQTGDGSGDGANKGDGTGDNTGNQGSGSDKPGTSGGNNNPGNTGNGDTNRPGAGSDGEIIGDDDNPLAGPQKPGDGNGGGEGDNGPIGPNGNVVIKKSDNMNVALLTSVDEALKGDIVKMHAMVYVTDGKLTNFIVHSTADDGIKPVFDSVNIQINGERSTVPFELNGGALSVYAGTVEEGDVIDIGFDALVSVDSAVGAELETEMRAYGDGTDTVVDDATVVVVEDRKLTFTGDGTGSGSGSGSADDAMYAKPIAKTGDAILSFLASYGWLGVLVLCAAGIFGVKAALNRRDRMYEAELLGGLRKHPHF